MNNHFEKTETSQNIKNCRAVSLEDNNFAECLLEGPNSCPYALPFGYCFLCQHPQLSEIVENTKNGRPYKTGQN